MKQAWFLIHSCFDKILQITKICTLISVGNYISGALSRKTDARYMFYTKCHLPRPIFHSPSSKSTRIGERASVSFPDCWSKFYLFVPNISINNQSVLVYLMAWHWTNKRLPSKLVITLFIDTIINLLNICSWQHFPMHFHERRQLCLHLTHCGLVTSYGGRDLGQHLFR